MSALFCKCIQVQDSKKPLSPISPVELLPRMTSWEYYGNGETAWAVVPGWNRTQAVWKTDSAKGKLTMEGAQMKRKGVGWEWWRAKEKKDHMPPRKISGRAGGGGGRKTCRKQVPRHGTASLSRFFSELDYAKERGEIYSLPAVQRLTTLLLLSG